MSNTNGKELIDQIFREYNCTCTGRLIVKTIGELFSALPEKFNRYFTYEVRPKGTKHDVIVTWWFDNGYEPDWVECILTKFNSNNAEIILTTIPNNQPAITNTFILNEYQDRTEVMYMFIKEFITAIVGSRKLIRVTNNKPMKEDESTVKTNSVEIKPTTKDTRISWHQYFMEMCDLVAKRSTCLRRKVGAVLVKDNQVLSTGYNGAPKHVSHCADRGGCMRQKLNIPSGKQQELCMASHAEMNAIAQAACMGIKVEGAILYCNTRPCSICTRIIINAGIKEVYYREYYPDEFSDQLFKEAGIKLEQLTN